MRLRAVKIQNHSRLADLDLEIREHAVLVGANDVGKTSLLRCLNLLLGAGTPQLYQQLTIEDLRDVSLPLKISATLTNLTDHERAVFPDAITVTPDGEERLVVELEALPDEMDETALSIHRGFPDAGYDRAPSRDQLEAIGWRYLPANRTTSAEGMEGKRSALRAMLSSVDLGVDAVQLVKQLEVFNGALEANEGFTELREAIAEQLSRAMPRTVGADDLAIRTGSDPATELLENVTLFLKEKDKFKALAEQSDGVRQLMSVAFFDLAGTSANIVAIDEPELHLHPTSQATAASLFVNGQNQKILATHSPYIVHQFDPSQVVVVSPEQTFKQLDPSRFTEVGRLRINWWSPNLLQALTARRVIVVEGLADRLVLQGAAGALKINLDRLGVTVFDLDGADKFKYVYRLLGPEGFGVQVLGLVDEDHEAQWMNEVKARPKTLNEKGIFVARPDLEGEYAAAFTGPVAAQILTDEDVCPEQGVLQACDAGEIGEVTDEDLAEFARCSKRKVLAAAALAKHLTPDIVREMPGIHGLLQMVKGL